MRTYKEIRADYTYDGGIFNAEPYRLRVVKYIVWKVLSEVDRTIFLIYTDCRSYRALGKRLGVSHTTARREVMRIKKLILDEYGKHR